MPIVPTPRHGEIWLIDFDPAVGAEMRKIRPAVVVNLDSIGRLPLRLVVPITDWKSLYSSYPWFVEIPVSSTNGLIKQSGADAFQTKSISVDRFVRHIGDLTQDQMLEIAEVIAMCVGAP
jgi:mRNA interferase MazF